MVPEFVCSSFTHTIQGMIGRFGIKTDETRLKHGEFIGNGIIGAME